MENHNEIIQGLINALLVIIPLGVGARIIHTNLAIMTDEDRAAEGKRRNKHALVFLIFAETLIGLIGILQSYFI